MCYFDGAKIISKKRIKKADAIIGYKVLAHYERYSHKLCKYVLEIESPYRHDTWRNGRLSTGTNSVNFYNDGFGEISVAGTGIHVFKSKVAASRYLTENWDYRRDTHKVVAVKLYGHVVEFKYPVGYLATRAEIINEN